MRVWQEDRADKTRHGSSEHPFSDKERSDAQPRPKPVGHEDLNSNWVGAVHLKIGDKIKQADGTVGVVANVTTVQQTQEMFNLTVDEAHTFYVGTQGWLVHKEGWCPTLTRYVAKGQQTEGVFAAGGNQIPLISGMDGPGYTMFKEVPGAPVPNLTINTHVEAHTAAMMHQGGIESATLYINNMPCTGHLDGCLDYLKYMIPENSTLRVVLPKGINDFYPNRWEHTFTGVKP